MNRQESKQRRELAAQIIKNGGTVKEAAEKTGLGMTSIYNACREQGVISEHLQNNKARREEAREKRRQAAELIRNGKSIGEASVETGLSIRTVQDSLHEFGVIDPNGKKATKIIESQIAEKIRNKVPTEVICKEYNVSYARVLEISNKAKIDSKTRRIGMQTKFNILNRLISSTDTLRDISKEFNTNEANVTAIYRYARKSGIQVSERKPGQRSKTKELIS